MSQSWKTAYVSTIISKAISVSDPNFDLDKVKGRVVINEEVTIPVSQTTVVKGLTMITRHHKHVHVLVELSHKCLNVFILGNTSKLKPGNSDIEVVIQNRSGKDVKLKPGTKIGTVISANMKDILQKLNLSGMEEGSLHYKKLPKTCYANSLPFSPKMI